MQTTKPQLIASLRCNWNVQFSVRLFCLFDLGLFWCFSSSSILVYFFFSSSSSLKRSFEFIHLTVAFRFSNSCTALHNLTVLSLLFIKCIEIEFNCPIHSGWCLTSRVYWFSFVRSLLRFVRSYHYSSFIYETNLWIRWSLRNGKLQTRQKCHDNCPFGLNVLLLLLCANEYALSLRHNEYRLGGISIKINRINLLLRWIVEHWNCTAIGWWCRCSSCWQRQRWWCILPMDKCSVQQVLDDWFFFTTV